MVISEHDFYREYLSQRRIPLDGDKSKDVYEAFLSVREASLGIFKHYFFALIVLLRIHLKAVDKVSIGMVELKSEYFAYAGLAYLAFCNFTLSWYNAKTRVLHSYFINAWYELDEPSRCWALIRYPHAYPATYFFPSAILSAGWTPKGLRFMFTGVVPVLMAALAGLIVLNAYGTAIWSAASILWDDPRQGIFKYGLLAVVGTSVCFPWMVGPISKRPVAYEYSGLATALYNLRKRNPARHAHFKKRIALLQQRRGSLKAREDSEGLGRS